MLPLGDAVPDGEEEVPLGADELLGVLLEEDAPGLLEPEEGGVERVAEGELVPEELFWFDPELSQATSDNADSSAAAISHFLSIRSSPFGSSSRVWRSVSL